MSERDASNRAAGPLVTELRGRPRSGKIIYDAAEETVLFRMAQGLCRIVSSTLFDLNAYHADRVPTSGGLLIVSNHQSFLDPVAVGVAIPRSLSYMAKSELFENPLFSGLIRKFGAFPVRQTGSAAGAIKETIDRLREGRVLNIYPEGTRTPDGEIKSFEKGSALVVRKAQVPVVPAAIHGSFEAWPPGTAMPWPQKVTVMFGEAMVLHDRRPDEVVRTMEEAVRGLYAQLRAMDPKADERRANAVGRTAREAAEKARRRGR